VQGAVAGIVLADRAVQFVLGQQAVHALLARRAGKPLADDIHPLPRAQRTAALQTAVDFDPADIAGLQRTERGVIADMRQADAVLLEEIDQRLVFEAAQLPAVEAQGAADAAAHGEATGSPAGPREGCCFMPASMEEWRDGSRPDSVVTRRESDGSGDERRRKLCPRAHA